MQISGEYMVHPRGKTPILYLVLETRGSRSFNWQHRNYFSEPAPSQKDAVGSVRASKLMPSATAERPCGATRGESGVINGPDAGYCLFSPRSNS